LDYWDWENPVPFFMLAEGLRRAAFFFRIMAKKKASKEKAMASAHHTQNFMQR